MGRYNDWTDAELRFLEANYHKTDMNDLATYLSRHTPVSIAVKAQRLGLSRKYARADEYGSPKYWGMSIKEQAAAMGKSYSATWSALRKRKEAADGTRAEYERRLRELRREFERKADELRAELARKTNRQSTINDKRHD